MPSREESIQTFVEVTGESADYARTVLATCQWDVDMAVSLHFSSSPAEIAAMRNQSSPTAQPQTSDNARTTLRAEPTYVNGETRDSWVGWAFKGVSSVVKGIAGFILGNPRDFASIYKGSFGEPFLPFLAVTSLPEAVEIARERGQLLVILVHHPSSVPSADLCRTLQREPLRSVLSERATLYGTFADSAEGNQIMSMVHVNSAPAICVLKVTQGSPRALMVKSNLVTPEAIEELAEILRNEGSASLTGPSRAAAAGAGPASSPLRNNPDIPYSAVTHLPTQPSQAELRRLEREEQDREYQESLRIEEERREQLRREQEEQERIQREAAEAEAAARAEAQEAANRVARAASEVVAAFEGFENMPNKIRIRLRMPNGENATLSIPREMSGALLYSWVAALPELPQTLLGGMTAEKAKAAVPAGCQFDINIPMPFKTIQRNQDSLEAQGVEDGLALLVVKKD